MALSLERDGYLLTDDPGRVDLDVVHGFLRTSYWAENVPRNVVERSLAHSLVLSLHHADRQVGFLRIVTDRAVFAWIADVFVLDAHRGRGLARWMTETALALPDLEGLRLTLLGTRDAHDLYAKCGFSLAEPGRFMAIRRAYPR
jgi:GNAT superfamily N-acetyltransferase